MLLLALILAHSASGELRPFNRTFSPADPIIEWTPAVWGLDASPADGWVTDIGSFRGDWAPGTYVEGATRRTSRPGAAVKLAIVGTGITGRGSLIADWEAIVDGGPWAIDENTVEGVTWGFNTFEFVMQRGNVSVSGIEVQSNMEIDAASAAEAPRITMNAVLEDGTLNPFFNRSGDWTAETRLGRGATAKTLPHALGAPGASMSFPSPPETAYVEFVGICSYNGTVAHVSWSGADASVSPRSPVTLNTTSVYETPCVLHSRAIERTWSKYAAGFENAGNGTLGIESVTFYLATLEMPQGWGNNTFPATLATSTDTPSGTTTGDVRGGGNGSGDDGGGSGSSGTPPGPSDSSAPGKKAIAGAVAGGVVGGVVGTLLLGALIYFLRRRRRARPQPSEKPADPNFDIDPPSPTPFIHGPALPGKAPPPASPRADKTAEASTPPHSASPSASEPQSTLPPHVTAALAANRGGDTLLSPLNAAPLPPLLAQTKGLKTPLEAELAGGVRSPLSASPRSPARPNEIYPLHPLQSLQPLQPVQPFQPRGPSASPLTPSPETPFSPFTQERDAGVVVEDGVMEFIPPSYDPAWAASREGRIAAAAAGYGTVVRPNP